MLIIRSVNNKDFDKLAKFFCENNLLSVKNNFNPFALNEKSAEFITSGLHNDRYYVGYLVDDIIGFVMLRGWDEGYEVPSFGLLIDRNYYGFGFGKKLSIFALEQAKIIGCKKVRLSVYKDNLKAVKLYLSLGFKEMEQINIDFNGRERIKIVMIKELGNEQIAR